MSSTLSLVINESDVRQILESITPETFIGKGADGKIHAINYYNIPAAVKIPNNVNAEDNVKHEIVIYGYLCKQFNKCKCKQNVVQMLGYNMKESIIILEYFDGYDLTKYVGYPVHSSTFYTHRLLPRSIPSTPDFTTLGKYLNLSDPEEITFTIANKIYTGLTCLHGIGILHKDIELKNILIRSNGDVSISDFGISRIVGKNVIELSFEQIFRNFKDDWSTLGPIMGNFLDSNNPEPYQYRLDVDSTRIDNFAILNSLTNDYVKDAFLLLTLFKDILAFVSVIYYINLHTDMQAGRTLIEEAAGIVNEHIDSEVPESERNSFYLYEKDVINIVDELYDTLMENIDLYRIIKYFRNIIQEMLKMSKLSTDLDNISIHDYIKEKFGDNYTTAIESFVSQLRYGFLLKNFGLFTDLYRI